MSGISDTGLHSDVELDVERIRADFPILASVLHAAPPRAGVPLAYLDNAATTQRPRQVIDAIVDTYEKHYANVHRGLHWLSDPEHGFI